MSYHFCKKKKKVLTSFEPNWQDVLALRQMLVLPQLTLNSCLLSKCNLSTGSTWPAVSLASKVWQESREGKPSDSSRSGFPVKTRSSLGFSPPPHLCLAVSTECFTKVEVAST